MPSSSGRTTVAGQVIGRLAELGVTHIFGYPGGQITPLYDALYIKKERVRHVLARDEQAAAFMADGYARATGKPGVTLAVCGPGVLNAATPLATAYTDSIPMLLLTGQVPSKGAGLRSGYYHENDQALACTPLTKARYRIDNPGKAIETIDLAYRQTTKGRPGPVLLEIPLDVLRMPSELGVITLLQPARKQELLRSSEAKLLTRLVQSWQQPVILAGGGVVHADATNALVAVAERLGAPVFHTLNGKSAFPNDHPLCAGLPWLKATSDLTGMEPFFSPVLAMADGILALGCRFTQATTGTWVWKPPPSLVHVDLDPKELGRHYKPTLGICADAGAALKSLLAALPPKRRLPWTIPPDRTVEPAFPGFDLLGAMRRVLPRNVIIAADVTRLVYRMVSQFPVLTPRSFLHPAGFVSMGYAIPAALGAKAAYPDRPVVAVVGDGGFQMSGMELASAVQERLPIVIILVNDCCLSLIKSSQDRHYGGRHIAVDLRNPDFAQFAAAFGVRAWRTENDSQFETALKEALKLRKPALVEVVLQG